MNDVVARLGFLLRVLVPFLFMMATVYLVGHVLFARLVRSPQSQVLWFFAVVTNPLTRPIRGLLPPGTSDSRVRAVALAVYLLLWIVADRLLKLVGPIGGG